jgi:hypothetical protein
LGYVNSRALALHAHLYGGMVFMSLRASLISDAQKLMLW